MKVFAASNTQAGLPALSSGEAEVRALTRAATEGVYLNKVLMEMGLKVKTKLKCDASAALQNAEKLGPGRIKHLVTSAHFIKGVIRRREATMEKLGTDNMSDILSKGYDAKTLVRDAEKLGLLANFPEEVKYQVMELEKVNVWNDVEQVPSLAGAAPGATTTRKRAMVMAGLLQCAEAKACGQELNRYDGVQPASLRHSH